MRRVFQCSLFMIAAVSLVLPSISMAAGLSAQQRDAILGLLKAFSVDARTIDQVEMILAGSVPLVTPVPVRARPTDNLYPSSSLGYDISFSTASYPADWFGFGTVGVTRGKAFVHNPRFPSQYLWARAASSVAPSLYMNLNAPYGTTATVERLSSPRSCAALFTGATTTAGTRSGVYPEPTECAAYNYGYNAAADAFAHATAGGASAAFWWLDVEEENSWSEQVEVNRAVIQGAIDFFNAKNERVGIYSMPYMWRDIAGQGFAPTQSLGGKAVSTPVWLPIGIANQVQATNACLTREPFIPGSPLWVIQYVQSSTAVDQNVAC